MLVFQHNCGRSNCCLFVTLCSSGAASTEATTPSAAPVASNPRQRQTGRESGAQSQGPLRSDSPGSLATEGTSKFFGGGELQLGVPTAKGGKRLMSFVLR